MIYEKTQIDRIQEHFSLRQNRIKESVLLKHWKKRHEETRTVPGFSVKTKGTYLIAAERQIGEVLLELLVMV